MPQQLASSVENNFTKGYITESTGLNFPENAATDTDNCLYTIVGDVIRRAGIDFEDNFTTAFIDRGGKAMHTYKWVNAGGDGLSQLLVSQVGSTLYFYDISTSTNTSPLSQNILNASVDISAYSNSTFSTLVLKECEFADGNGYLFVFHPECSPFYITYNPVTQTVSSSSISVKIRDFTGVVENPTIASDFRPQTLSATHKYNLLNQGWTDGSGNHTGVTVGSGSPAVALGPLSVPLTSSTAGFTVGNYVTFFTINAFYTSFGYIPSGTAVMGGTVTGYAGTSLNVTITETAQGIPATGGALLAPYTVTTSGQGYIQQWNSATTNYPSNSDVWWYYKSSTGAFSPSTTIANVTLSTGDAPKGHYIVDAFNQSKGLISGVAGITNVTATKKPRTGCWFQGRVWYTGVDASQQAGGTSDYYTWTSSIYFSQIVTTPADFGKCYQTNDPTSENLFDLLPTDGGIVTIPEAGSIYKLFPMQNGMLIFASNGVWFITGSRGIGFTANDYTITKISAVPSISGTSFVDVYGLPYFWNEEGIYTVTQQQGGGLSVDSITVSTIDTFFDSVPKSAKKLARGSFNPIEFTIQWIFKDTEATDVTDAYSFNRIMNYNVFNKAFFPYSVSTDVCSINGINFVSGPGGLDTPDPTFRYLVTLPNLTGMTWATAKDGEYTDWGASGTARNYNSYFITGYKLRGQAIHKFQPQYIQIYRRVNGGPSAYKLQGIWDYAADANSGRWSTVQVVDTGLSRYNTLFKRHKLRGHGYALQFKISSVEDKPFDIQGWAVVDTVNQGT